MSADRVAVVQRNLDAYLAAARPASRLLAPEAPVAPGSTLTAGAAVDLFQDQLLSRAVDVEARRLKTTGRSFYTISSAGHEQNAVLGAQLRLTDPCLLHYRSGALMMARARHDPGTDMVRDAMLSVCASREDPTSGGRHKVWGSLRLRVPPQTSTIASHLPKAVGMAFALARARRVGVDPGLPPDAIVCCSFGDASANHASALTAIGAARYGSRRGNPMPILFVCEDNGIGISTETPRRWIRNSFSHLTFLRYLEATGTLDQIWGTVDEAVHVCRSTRAPVFLRLETVRLWGHAGSDIESAYRSPSDIEATEARDPLLLNARRLVEVGAADPERLRTLVVETRERVREVGEWAATRPHLSSAAEVMAPLAPWDEARVRASATGVSDPTARAALWAGEPPEAVVAPVKRTLAAHLSAALADEMLRRPEIVVFGEDVGRKGGVYYVTAGLQKRLGASRVIDTHLDETSILGLAQGAALAGLLPVPEIQYLAYVHNAVDQLRGEAASLQFFSAGQFSNPMVVRIASFAYQKGFGGHFHNDHAIGGLRDIPGLVLAAPARGDDAVRMLRGCLALARECGRVVCFLEPIALYHEKDLHAPGDAGWLFDYPAPGEALLPGEVGVYPSGIAGAEGDGPGGPGGHGDILLLSYANGLRMSLQAQRILQVEHGLPVRVVDLRWLNPLPFEAVRREAAGAAAVLVVDECRSTGGGIAEAVVAHLAERDHPGPLRSLRAPDTYVPLGPAADTVLIQTRDVVRAVLELAAGRGERTHGIRAVAVGGEGSEHPGDGDRSA
ncbi:MAG: thiamine pyrophosphate-dependent enzyme [Longimicrobiales bacterium]|nr:thiamine pyrophosphate-dependent enzyme [Longimicrobiales bacterium]